MTRLKLSQSKICLPKKSQRFAEASRSLESYWKVHIWPLFSLSPILPPHEEGCTIQMELIMPIALQEYQEAFVKFPVLRTPILGKSLVLYIKIQERSLRSFYTQENEEGKQRALYQLSHTLVWPELNSSLIKKLCLALTFSIQKLRY